MVSMGWGAVCWLTGCCRRLAGTLIQRLVTVNGGWAMAVDRWVLFGALLRGHRRRVGLSQRELAERAGLSLTTVRDLEQGRTRQPQPPSLRALAAALGLGEDDVAALHDSVAGSAPMRAPGHDKQGFLRLDVLGPLTLRRGSGEVALGRGGRRVVLARLALSASGPVPVDELVDLLWGEAPPRNPHQLLQSYVSRLRLVLGSAGPDRRADGVLSLGAGGYRLVLAEQQLDVCEFRALVRTARQVEPPEAVELLENALRLWRDVPVADVCELRDHPLVTALVQEYVTVALWYADLAAQLGDCRRSLPRLRELVDAHPLHEPIHARLVTALAGAGLQADALAAYDAIRRRLADELGIDPGPELTEAHRRVLRQEVTVAAGGGAPAPLPAGAARRVEHRDELAVRTASHTGEAVLREEDRQSVTAVPRLPPRALPASPPAGSAAAPPLAAARALPRDLADFTGRAELLSEFLAAVTPADKPATAPVIYAIDGMPGVGKTALAVHWAHLVADRYPDGQLYMDLHGHSDQAPLRPAAAVDALLRQLGVAGDRIPDEFDQRVAMWRRALAGRRTLLLLDNAATAGQIGPLLPAEPGCLTLITSRRRLVGLDGVRAVSLGGLTAEEAVTLQRRIVGARVDAAPEAAQEVARLCGYLALAIRLAAARLAHRPAWSAAHLVARLGRAQTPLRELALPGRSVEAAFALSYHDLSRPAGRLFRLLGLHPGPDIDVRAAAALGNLDLDAADEVLAELVDTHLIEESSVGRYRLHDLIRDYAVGLAADEPERDEAVDRLLTYYLHAAAACDVWLAASVARLRIDDGTPPPQVAPARDARAATDWLTAEQANIAKSIRLAAANGRDRIAWRLAQAAWRFLYIYGYLDEYTGLCEVAVAAAQRAGELHGEAAGHNNLAGFHFKRGRWDQALRHVDRAIALRATLDEPMLHAGSLANKAAVLQYAGDFHAALHSAGQASKIIKVHDPLSPSSNVEITLGQIKGWMGDEAAAERHFRAMSDGPGGPRFQHRRREALCHVGELRLWRGRYAEAAELLHESTADWDEAWPSTHCFAKAWLGSTYCALGRLDDALPQHSQAMALAEQHRELAGECEAAVRYGITLHAAADTSGALKQLRHALDICDRVALPLYEALAAAAMADLYTDTDPARSAQYRARADALYARLHVVPPVSVLAAYRATQQASRSQTPARRSDQSWQRTCVEGLAPPWPDRLQAAQPLAHHGTGHLRAAARQPADSSPAHAERATD
jgi:DNA-binding SARP family transcriptional activator/DNA-binding XRE family transcriptional regulator